MNKDAILKAVADVTDKVDSSDAEQLETAINSLKEMKIQEKYYVDVLSSILNKAMDQSGNYVKTRI